ncbi:UNVERIFIED_CONTAM: hypothetical protein Slati_1435500 [Sesamum latifolium]|uniref:Reverse transcriptase domain-containing protein n=1 Tax=Sesamum latifolium TaxID=2727402 RepID=A0AAW2X5C9_9LAMI
MPRSFTATTIVLIPKVDSPQTWNDFRPISLCNVTNKILSKLLYRRISQALPELISPSQSGFVPGRLISDNILLAQEMIHHLDLRYKNSNLVIKLDMSKAYDRVSWAFLLIVMQKMGFPTRFLTLIKHAIKNCWFTVLVNGEAAGFFKSTQGLRQGDPISPALFILAAEALSKGLDFLFSTHPDMYYQTQCAIKPSHLSYADDVIIFTNCKEAGLARLIQFLRGYENMSGQKINYAKSAFIPGRKASLIAQRIKAITGFTMKALPITYLGAPLYKGGLGIRNLRDMVTAFSYKLWWRVRLNNSLWSRFTISKYCQEYSPSISKLFATDSSIWKRMCGIRTDAQSNIFWSLGDGTISFWHDWWLPEGILANLVGTQCSLHIPVNWFWLEHEWDIHKLQQAVPQHIIEKIMDVPINTYHSDYLHWKLSKHGAFTTKSAWDEIRSRQPVRQFYRTLWSKLIIPNISVFTWRLIHNWIPVDERLKQKGISLVSKCLCCDAEETIPHLFLHNVHSLEVWGYFASKFQVNIPHTNDITMLIQSWKIRIGTKPHIRDVIPLLILWNIWNLRNDSKYEGVVFKASIIIRKTMTYLHNLHKRDNENRPCARRLICYEFTPYTSPT